jgi:hypothetical protein
VNGDCSSSILTEVPLMLNGCNSCGWVRRSARPGPLASRCPRCGRPTSSLRYESVYGPAREYRAGAGNTAAGRVIESAGTDPPRC